MKVIQGKVCFVGSDAAGKTSIISHYMEKHFNPRISKTIGVSFTPYVVWLDTTTVKLQIFDIAGGERNLPMVLLYYENTNATVLVFDTTDMNTFHDMKLYWKGYLKKNTVKPCLLFVVASKIDNPNRREVSHEEALAYSQSINATYYECSAKTGQGIEELFEGLATKMAQMASQYKNHRLKVTYECNVMEQERKRRSGLQVNDGEETDGINLTSDNKQSPRTSCFLI